MKFEVFLEQDLHEAPTTAHSKVESALRSLNLKYKTDRSDTGRAFYLDKGYILISMNSGSIILNKRFIKGAVGEIAAKDVLDSSKILGNVEELLKDKAKDLFASDSKELEKETSVA